MSLKFIDVSQHNGVVNWKKVAQSVDGCIIRLGYRGYGTAGTLTVDKQFKYNISNAISNGVKRIGVYWLSQAKSVAEANAEVTYIVNELKAYKSHINCPVYLDSEWANDNKLSADYHKGRADGLSKADRTTISIAFLDGIKKAGYVPGIYASTSWFVEHLDDTKLTNYSHWVAEYSVKCNYSGSHDAWQKSERGTVAGIAGYVDLSEFYKDFASVTDKVGASTSSAATQVSKASQSTTKTFKSGDKVTLTDAGLYTSATAKNATAKKSGTFYVYNPTISNGRIRITNAKTSVGKLPASKFVTGWINVSDAK